MMLALASGSARQRGRSTDLLRKRGSRGRGARFDDAPRNDRGYCQRRRPRGGSRASPGCTRQSIAASRGV